MTIKALFRSLKRALFPKGFPLTFEVVDLRGHNCYGLCHHNKDGSYHIQVCSSLPPTLQSHFLVHEIAHAMVPTDTRDHGPLWGAAYSIAYTCAFEDPNHTTQVGRKRKSTC